MLLCILLASCRTSEKIVYLQDVAPDLQEAIHTQGDITLKPQDKLSIVVSSKDPKLAALLNLPVVSYQAGSTSTYNQMTGYTVDDKGNIDFPILGTIHVGDLTRAKVAEVIKEKIISQNLVNDPVVTVDYRNLHISVLGEVSKPGQINIDRDKITLLEALSMAGDLTIYGVRDKVLVIRETEGKRAMHYVDLRSKDIFQSPVYYLQQNDIVYIRPNKVRAGQSQINDNNVKSASFWITIGSFLSNLGVLLFK